jgi:hypothetical protein
MSVGAVMSVPSSMMRDLVSMMIVPAVMAVLMIAPVAKMMEGVEKMVAVVAATRHMLMSHARFARYMVIPLVTAGGGSRVIEIVVIVLMMVISVMVGLDVMMLRR